MVMTMVLPPPWMKTWRVYRQESSFKGRHVTFVTDTELYLT